MKRPKRYYSLFKNEEDNSVDIYIYGDIVVPQWEGYESDTSGYSLVKEIDGLDVDKINIFINSYGGHLSEGLAIYNALKRHKAKIITYCDGYACSAASLVFMAGDERVMSNASVLWIHNAESRAYGNAEELRKAADDNELLSETAANVYLNHINISKEKLKEMMDKETFITPTMALEMGFATRIVAGDEAKAVSFNFREKLMKKLMQSEQAVPANVSIDKEMLSEVIGEIIEKEVKNLFKTIEKFSEKKLEEKAEETLEENKPLEMLKAFFNL